MISGNRDIDRPLGQGAGPETSRRGRFLSAERILVAIAAIAILGTSTAVSLRERPFRTPSPIAVSEPVLEPAEPAQQQATAPSRPDGTVPDAAIIRVDPDEEGDSGVIVIRDPSAVGQHPRLAHLPDRALIEESESGLLPVRGPGGRRPFDAYARSWSGAGGARIALVIGGLGLSQTTTQRAVDALRPEITLAFAPAGNSLGRWMQAARRAGHEIVLQVPMEPFGYPSENPGRNTLTIGSDAEQNLNRLRWALSRVTNYTGVMNYMGGRFTAQADAMKPVLSELGTRGLMYVDDGTSARSVAQDLARQIGVPFAAADTLIDPITDRRRPDPREIRKRLDELERIARAKGYAVGTGSAFDETIDTVAGWADEVTARGIELVPISAVATDPEAR
ncbi:divergent polysaccharide deacetylase family protein [Nitratireductor sp. ZSWI3]|uniref:divergent polysaccharide deacetylase family protein n=1 Tax=Nitratireductor sp. ZSWI3 TaxID=2966359 RepID=UPI0021502137|nr:divergent polysaccharide deacetylase family protein [Nitratireductor sp. ZSWI3]MCR4267859.1 divergent polysaccharide deacetylase family protein [Nitratireductor sp. ZSWI3]